MKLDSANRSFLAMSSLALLLGTYVLCGAIGSVLLPLVIARISHHGLHDVAGSARSSLTTLLFIASVVTGLALGARSLYRQMAASHRLARRVRGLTRTLPHELAGVAATVGLAGRLVLLDSPEWFSFAFGALTPRVAISRGLLEGISDVELRAVLEHERYHVCNLDPLKAMLGRALSATFFLLPALDSLQLRYLAARELAADRRAVRACGPRPLAGALLKVVRGPEWSELEVASAIGGRDLLDVRVAQLESGVQPELVAFSLRRATLSLASAALFAATLTASALSLGGPAAARHGTGTGLGNADLLGALTCAIPFAGVALIVYWLLARRAGRPLATKARR